jgi:hypothetical protein
MLKYDVVMLKYNDCAFSKNVLRTSTGIPRARGSYVVAPHTYDIQAIFPHTMWVTFSTHLSHVTGVINVLM